MTTNPNQGPNPDPPHNPTPLQAGRGSIRDLTGWVIIAILVFLGLIALWFIWGNSSDGAPGTPTGGPTTTSATQTPSPTVTPTGNGPLATTVPPSNPGAVPPPVGLNPACPSANPVLPAHWLAQSLRYPATDHKAFDPLPAYQAAGANAVAYMGAHVGVSAASDLVGAIYCNDMTPFFDPDPVFNDLGIDGAKAYINQLVAARPGMIKMWIVGQNDNPGAYSVSTNARVAVIRSLNTQIPVLVITDQFSANLAQNVTRANLYLADSHGFGYFPFTGSSKYGSESSLPTDAESAMQLDGSNATGIVQEFSWWKADAKFAKAMGFAHTSIQPRDVARMATSLLTHGDRSVLLLSLEPEQDNTTGFIVPCLKAVKAANPDLGN